MTFNPMIIGLLTFSVFATAGVYANPHDGKPPKEAIAACADSAENDKVSFETPRGDTIEATCTLMDGELVAVPEGGAGERPDRPRN